jgi:DNA-binding MarR family transcriptional regulator
LCHDAAIGNPPEPDDDTPVDRLAMNDDSISVTSFHLPKAVAELFEHLSRAVYSLSFSEGLNPAQWNALRYLNRANPSSRTMSAFARFHVTTRSTASQTLAALVRKKLIKKARDPADGRIVRLELTPKGQRLLDRDPVNHLVAALESLPADRQRIAAETVETLIRAVFARKA